MTSITVNIPSDVNDALKRGASQQMISKAALVRILLTNHVRAAKPARKAKGRRAAV
jgi:hypothetical protein